MVTNIDSYCNPVNLNYRFQVEGWAKECLREAADPSVVYFQGEYWLFASKSGGYWHSSDLSKWHFIETTQLPIEDYAPDVRVINGMLYFTASRLDVCCPIFRTTDPKSDQWEKVSEPLAYWDPNMFQDDDGRVYLYWGCSNVNPLYGVELDPETMQPITEPLPLIEQTVDQHGWERTGENGSGSAMPYVEGAWMTKHSETYYLQYSAPGTEWNVYGDGVYTGPSPLGPFTYASHNPFSFKPGGFITGAGHGSTFWDIHGNLWHVATMRVSVKHDFERRVGLFPAGFDKDGVLFCNTSFGDYPTRHPRGRWDPWKDSLTGWMLLSYEKPVRASSALAGRAPSLAVNENIREYWSASSGEAGEWLEVDLVDACSVHAIQVNFAEQDCRHFGRGEGLLAHRYLIEASEDGSTWRVVCDKRSNDEDVPHDYIELPTSMKARFLRITNYLMPADGHFAISGFRVFGFGNVKKAEVVKDVRAVRDSTDYRNAELSWEPSSSAVGYNVWWGIEPDKLYNSWLIYDDIKLKLHALDKALMYWVRVDAFNECGVEKGVVVAVSKLAEG